MGRRAKLSDNKGSVPKDVTLGVVCPVNGTMENPPTQAGVCIPASFPSAEDSTLVLTGELTIADAATLHQTLLAALRGGAGIRVDLTDVVYVDAAILQLLCAAQKSAAAHGGQVMLQGVQDSVIQDARLLGLESVLLGRSDVPRTVEAECQKQR